MSDGSSGGEAIAVAALTAAVEGGDEETARALVARHPELAGVSIRDVHLVRMAAYAQMTGLVDDLLALDVDLDVFDAASLGRTDVLAALLDADPTLVEAWSTDGFTPLHLAAFFGHIRPTELLLNRGADPEPVSRNDMAVRPINSAAGKPFTIVVHLLLDHGADADAAMTGGYRPLHAAAHNGQAAVVKVLLERGADPNARNDAGETAADVAADDAIREILASV
jgi:ankyrin repeat protein